jgi:hypothetical protein
MFWCFLPGKALLAHHLRRKWGIDAFEETSFSIEGM